MLAVFYLFSRAYALCLSCLSYLVFCSAFHIGSRSYYWFLIYNILYIYSHISCIMTYILNGLHIFYKLLYKKKDIFNLFYLYKNFSS
jgi:hypothetical protein